MTFEELLMVIDPNADGGEILELEFRGNEEYNRVRSDCVEILEPLFEYQVNSIGINDNGEQRIWLDPPKRADTPLTEETCERCVYVRGSQWCQGCNGTPKKWDGEKIVDTPQTDCDTCKHYKLACELFSEVCKYEPTTQTETENSNLTFEKVMEEIQTQVIEFPDTHQKFTFARKIEMDGDSIKIGGWEYKGVKDAERFVKGSEQTERSE